MCRRDSQLCAVAYNMYGKMKNNHRNIAKEAVIAITTTNGK